MSCETCGGTGGVGPDVVLPRSRLAVPGADGFVLVEYHGEVPMEFGIESRSYLFKDGRRRLYMTRSDYELVVAVHNEFSLVDLADPAAP